MTDPMYFEDFRVGMTFEGKPRVVSQEDHQTFMDVTGDRGAVHLDPQAASDAGFDAVVTNGPLGIGVVFGQLFELGIVEPTAIATLDLDWAFRRPVLVGDTLRLHLLVTRCRRSSTRRAGVIGRHMRLVNQDDMTVQEGSSSMLVHARGDSGEDDLAVATDFGTIEWARRLVPLLNGNDDFRAATATFDGVFGLRAGRELVLLRIYKSEVIDVGRSMPHGATFILSGSEWAWVGLAFAPRNDLIARMSKDHFQASGDVFEYLRMTKALVALWDSVRELVSGGSAS